VRVAVRQAVVVHAEPQNPGSEELAGAGLYDPAAPDAADRLELVRLALARGAPAKEIAATPDLGALVVKLSLRPDPRYRAAEVVAESGVGELQAKRLLTALGLRVDRDYLMTAAEASALRFLAGLSEDLLGPEATVQVARVAGTAMARIADVLVGALRIQMELPRQAAGIAYSEVVREYTEIVERGLPEFMDLLEVALRHQLVDVAERVWTTDEQRTTITLPRTIGFVDLVGYTAASAAMSVAELASVLAEFDERVSGAVYLGNGQVVKTIGDEAMFVTEATADSCRIALQLIDELGRGRLPPVRIGLAAGDVLSVFGDVYGPDVNLAARLVASAEPSSIVVSDRVQSRCSSLFRFEPLDPLELKGFDRPVSAYRLLPGAPVRRTPPPDPPGPA
jgi:adenylate cyclase